MADEKEKTVLNPSVGADGGQPIPCTDTSITDHPQDCNDEFSPEHIEKLLREMKQANDPANLPIVTMRELYETVYQSRPPVIDGLLCSGTYLFAGAPKVGKSFLVAQLAYHVSTGQKLWEYDVRPGTVLYLALEDDYQRLQERMFRMFGVEETDKLYFATYAKQLGNGLDEQLDKFVREHPDTRLIIIDTLQKVREMGGEAYSYADDYQIVGRLKQFADRKGFCLLVVHHTRKQPSGDKFDMISGTNGLSGAADGAFLLQKEKRTDGTATLDVVGRDQQDQRFYLTKDRERLTWTLERMEAEQWIELPDPVLEAVEALVVRDKSWSGTATELVTALGVDIKPNKLTMRLNVNAGRLLNETSIKYESSRNHDGRFIQLMLVEKAGQ